jgi:phosphatidylinositol alpha-mannosyltransferase
VLLTGFAEVVRARPGARLLVAGRGDVAEVRAGLPAPLREAVIFLGQVDEQDKAALLRTVDVYVAPNLGGESFGIVLVEAMAAGATVLASDLDAFRRVCDEGRTGALFPVGDDAALASCLLELLGNRARREALRTAADVWVRRFDWSVVTRQVLAVYETVADSGGPVREDTGTRRAAGRLLRVADRESTP